MAREPHLVGHPGVRASLRRIAAWTIIPTKHPLIGVPYELLALGVGARVAGRTFKKGQT